MPFSTSIKRASLLGLTILSAVEAASLSCGVVSSISCAGASAAEQPCKTTKIPGGKEVVCDVESYFAYPGVFSWEQCKAKCAARSKCESFSYTFYEPLGEAAGQFGGAPECYLYTHPVANYTVPCSKAGTASLESFYDVACPKPSLITSGTVPKSPSMNIYNGTCNSELRWNGNQTQWARIVIESTHLNYTQVQCSRACRSHKGCKSYYYGNETQGFHIFPLSGKEVYTKDGPNGFAVPSCLLLSQPVAEYVVHETDIPSQFYDVNCPTS